MRGAIWIILILLVVLHQDFWWWDDYNPLVFGFIPISLAWHAGISIGAAVLWALAIRFAWPPEVDELDEFAPTPGADEGER